MHVALNSTNRPDQFEANKLILQRILDRSDIEPQFACSWVKTPDQSQYDEGRIEQPHIVLQVLSNEEKLKLLKKKVGRKKYPGLIAYRNDHNPGLFISENLADFEQYIFRILMEHTQLTSDDIRNSLAFSFTQMPEKVRFFSETLPYMEYKISGHIPNVQKIQKSLEQLGLDVRLDRAENKAVITVRSTLENFVNRLTSIFEAPTKKPVISAQVQELMRRNNIHTEDLKDEKNSIRNNQ